MKSASVIVFLTALATLRAAYARDEQLGEHPAVLQARAQASAGYDYASKFYPHPAWLYLLQRRPDTSPVPPTAIAPQPKTNAAPADGDKNLDPKTPATSQAGVDQRKVSTGPIDAPAIFYRVGRRDRSAGASR
jgi:hypothetical protein